MPSPSSGQLGRRHAKQRRLSREEVREIRMSMEPTSAAMAARFGVSADTIGAVRRGTNYGRLLPDERRVKELREMPPDLRPLAPWHYLIVGDVFMRDGLSLGQDRQEQLDAAWECKPHGRLPGDSTPACGCFPHEEGFGVFSGDGRPAVMVAALEDVA